MFNLILITFLMYIINKLYILLRLIFHPVTMTYIYPVYNQEYNCLCYSPIRQFCLLLPSETETCRSSLLSVQAFRLRTSKLRINLNFI